MYVFGKLTKESKPEKKIWGVGGGCGGLVSIPGFSLGILKHASGTPCLA